jgi:hypothetical protein
MFLSLSRYRSSTQNLGQKPLIEPDLLKLFNIDPPQTTADQNPDIRARSHASSLLLENIMLQDATSSEPIQQQREWVKRQHKTFASALRSNRHQHSSPLSNFNSSDCVALPLDIRHGLRAFCGRYRHFHIIEIGKE